MSKKREKYKEYIRFPKGSWEEESRIKIVLIWGLGKPSFQFSESAAAVGTCSVLILSQKFQTIAIIYEYVLQLNT